MSEKARAVVEFETPQLDCQLRPALKVAIPTLARAAE